MMTRTQFWILNATVLLIGVLFATHIYMSKQIRQNELNLVFLQRTIQEGSTYGSRWEKLALRTYQLSLQDPQLKDVLLRQQIRVTPKSSPPAAANTAPSTAESSNPVAAKSVPKK